MRDETTYWSFFGLTEAPFARDWYESPPQGPEAVARYLYHRIRDAGGPRRPLFRPSAIRLLVRHAGSDTDRINDLSARAMRVAWHRGDLVVAATAVQKVLDQSGELPLPDPGARRRALGWLRDRLTLSPTVLLGGLAALTMAVLFFAAGLYVGMDAAPAPTGQETVMAPRAVSLGLRLSRTLNGVEIVPLAEAVGSATRLGVVDAARRAPRDPADDPSSLPSDQSERR